VTVSSVDARAIRLHPSLWCPGCGASSLTTAGDAVACPGCGKSFPLFGGVPVLLREPPAIRYEYSDDDDLFRLLETFGRYYNVATFVDRRIRAIGARRVLAVGEGNGEYALALARKFSQTEFVAFDLDEARAARAERLRRMLGIDNAYFFVADATVLPFQAGAFDLVYERGVFHILPDKEAHLRELARLGPAAIVVIEMANGPLYLANWRVCQWLWRLGLGVRLDLSGHVDTVRHLRRIDAYHGWRHYCRLFERHGMRAHPIWHDFFVKRSYHRQFPGLVGSLSGGFGLDVTPAPRDVIR
jgi:protein-L-isoaspartate O-methyltransferase